MRHLARLLISASAHAMCMHRTLGVVCSQSRDARRRYLSLCNIMPTLVQTSNVSMMHTLAQVTCGVWRVACDVWRVTCDVWRVACGV